MLVSPDANDEIVAAKQRLRPEARARRRAAYRAAGVDAFAAAAGHFLEAIALAPGCVVSGYWPFRDEFDPRPLMAALLARGHVCALPVVAGRGKPLAFRVWRPGDELVEGTFGISAPGDDAAAATPRVLIVPLLAFDSRGYRLGYGGGYYDRTLGVLRAEGRVECAVGLGFEAQRVDAVPGGASDERLDWVVTERRALEVA